MDKPTCKTCPYLFRAYMFPNNGYCHRKPPVPVSIVYTDPEGFVKVEFETRWPDVGDTDYCGEHPDFPAWLADQKPETKSRIEQLEEKVIELEGAVQEAWDHNAGDDL
jgi:hypothetical protein